jgi:hypothetical protein
MPSFSLATQVGILRALFQGVPLSQVSALYAALHSGNPGEAGTQSTNETAYDNYARVAVPCSPGSWIISPGDPPQSQNLQSIQFPACGAIGDTLTFWSIGYAPSGPGPIVTSGPIGATAAYGFTADVNSAFFVPLLPPGLVPGQPVILYQFGPGMLLPGGFIEGQLYYVAVATGQDLVLAAAPGGAVVNAGTPGSGVLLPVRPLVVSLSVAPTFPPNSLFTFSD